MKSIKTFRTQICAFFALVSASLLFGAMAHANPVIPITASTSQPAFTPSAPTINAKSYILIDANSGKVIAEKDSDLRLPPASLTKVMSLFITSSALKSGAIHWDDKVHISSKAWKAEGSRMFVKVNDDVPVRDLFQGVTVDSGNDATIALAEYIAGTEEAFAGMMNEQAKTLGLNNSHFTDSTGLPDPAHYSTAHDFATLAQAYIKTFPEDYKFFSEKWMTWNKIRQPNRNRLLWLMPDADGLKTGHTNDAGFCLISSANRNGMRLISVIMGSPSERVRTEESMRLLNFGFRFYETRKLYDANQPVTIARVWKGKNKEVALGLPEAIYVTIPASQAKNMQSEVVLESALKAPVVKGQPYATLRVTVNNQVVLNKPLLALEDDPKGSLWRSLHDSVSYGLHKIFSKSSDTLNNG